VFPLAAALAVAPAERTGLADNIMVPWAGLEPATC
jgi:hypothetical protein